MRITRKRLEEIIQEETHAYLLKEKLSSSKRKELNKLKRDDDLSPEEEEKKDSLKHQ